MSIVFYSLLLFIWKIEPLSVRLKLCKIIVFTIHVPKRTFVFKKPYKQTYSRRKYIRRWPKRLSYRTMHFTFIQAIIIPTVKNCVRFFFTRDKLNYYVHCINNIREKILIILIVICPTFYS